MKKEEVDVRLKIREYERSLIDFLFSGREDEDDRQLADMYMYEDQGGQ